MEKNTRGSPARLLPPWLVLLIAALLTGCSTTPKQKPEVVEQKNRAAEYTDYGNRAYTQGEYASALTFFEQALAINLSVDNQPGVVRSLSSIGKVHVALAELPEAEEVFVRARRLAAALADPILQAQCAVNLGGLLLAAERNTEARDLLATVVSEGAALEGSRDLAVLYHTLAMAEKKLGALEEARKHVEAALAINRKLAAQEEIASNYYLLASIYSKSEDYAQALTMAQLALETDKKVENSLGIAQDLLALGIISTKLGQDQEAFAYFERSYGIYSALKLTSGLRAVLPGLVAAAEKAGKDVESDAYASQLRELEEK